MLAQLAWDGVSLDLDAIDDDPGTTLPAVVTGHSVLMCHVNAALAAKPSSRGEAG